MHRRAAIVLAACGALLIVIGPGTPAWAGDASVSDGIVVYTDTPGQARQVNWARDASSIAIQEVVRNTGDPVTPSAGPGCTVASTSSVSATYICSADGVSGVRIDLGDGDDLAEPDTVRSSGREFDDINFPVTLLGGDGNDELTGGPAADTIDGGNGDDVLHAYRSRLADDPATAELSPDTVLGGPGNDTIDGGKNIDGGEGDDTISAPGPGATIAGGAGDDNIMAGRGGATIDGGDGDDTIEGGATADVIAGGAGNDKLSGGDGGDQLFGGAGADALDGGAGADRLDGGDGPDKLDGGSGADTLVAGPGDDSLEAEDGSADTLDCGAGYDRVLSWDRKKDRTVSRSACESVPEVGLDRKGSLVLGYPRAARTGKLRVRFHCVGCDGIKAGLQDFQFYEVPRRPGFALGSGCPPARLRAIPRVGIDRFEATIKLTPCERRSLSRLVGLERAGRAKLRIFRFTFRTPHSTGDADVRGVKRG